MQAGASSSTRLFGLDLMRAIAILLVLVAHTWPSKTGQNWAYVLGVLGVEMFFVLSGFLIGGILLRLADSQRFETGRDLFGFWKRRWYRTLPNYYLFLGLQLAWASWVLGYPAVIQMNWRYFFFLQNFNYQESFFFSETWSLVIEEWFYLLFAFLLWAMLRLTKQKDKAWWIAIGTFLLAPLLLRIWSAAAVIRSDPSISIGREIWDWNFRKVVLLRLDVLMYGVAAAFIAVRHPAAWQRLARFWWCGLLLIGLVITSVAIDWPLNRGIVPQGMMLWPCIAIGFTLFLPRLSLMTDASRWIARPIHLVAVLSYALYLCHGLVLLMLKQIFGPKSFLHLPKNTWPWCLAAWLVSFIIAGVVYRWFEKPIMNLRERTR